MRTKGLLTKKRVCAAYYAAWCVGWVFFPSETRGLAVILACVIAPVALWELVLMPRAEEVTDGG